jgi:hypothetical protein
LIVLECAIEASDAEEVVTFGRAVKSTAGYAFDDKVATTDFGVRVGPIGRAGGDVSVSPVFETYATTNDATSLVVRERWEVEFAGAGTVSITRVVIVKGVTLVLNVNGVTPVISVSGLLRQGIAIVVNEVIAAG